MVKILAVGFDVVGAIQQTLNNMCDQYSPSAHVQDSPPAGITFAADGGTVRWRECSAFTVSLSRPCDDNERTDLTPILYALVADKRVGRALMGWVPDEMALVAATSFTVPVRHPRDLADEGSQPNVAGVGKTAARQRRQARPCSCTRKSKISVRSLRLGCVEWWMVRRDVT